MFAAWPVITCINGPGSRRCQLIPNRAEIMNLTTEQQKELAQFPAVLRILVEAELAAGNSIIEVGHSFPAPPAGAYFKLANKISTRTRVSGNGIDFYERNSSIYSGEFTDAKRFYFILEPPNPPPPEPDMDAIRKSYEPKPDSLAQLARRSVRAAGGVEHSRNNSLNAERLLSPSLSSIRNGGEGGRRSGEEVLPRAFTNAETATGAKRILHFEDKRPPQEVQFALERELMTLFAKAMDNGKLCLLARGNVNGARYNFELRFEAALFFRNCYSLRVEASWAEQPANSHDYFRKTSDSWFSLWTRDLMAANPPKADAGSADRYRKLANAALEAEAHLDSVVAIQQAIITGMKEGGSYSTSHKEGGTNIFWRSGRFIRSDYGDYPDHQEFTDEAEFLKMLQQFCHWEVHRLAGPGKLSEFDIWKLILRRLHPK
jgi:hypothetical protein